MPARPIASFADVTAHTVNQGGPGRQRHFSYIDIGSIDNSLKRITEPKRLSVSEAPSRARQRIERGDVLVSMTRPNLNAVAVVPDELAGAVASTGFHVLRATDKVLPCLAECCSP